MSTTKRVAIAAALLAVLGVGATLALASGAVRSPRITAHPASWTRSRNANFQFVGSRAGETFKCSLDGAGFRSCGPSKGYGGLRDGRHVFRVEARTASGAVSDPARYAWTVDFKAPKLAVSFAAKDATYAHARWLVGCAPRRAGLCGSAGSPAGLKSVIVWVQQDATGRYYNGHAYSSKKVVWNKATLSPRPTNGKRVVSGRWFYRLPVPRSDGRYTMRVRATDKIGNINRAKTQKTVKFVIDTSVPSAPQITSGPADPTPATDATLTFTDSDTGVAYRCTIDGAGEQPCTSPISYSGLGVGTHLFEVRALNSAGRLSAPASYSWTIVPSGGLPFTISDDAIGPLHPGGATVTIPLTLANPNRTPIQVTDLAVTVRASSLPAGCSPSGYEIIQPSIPGAGVEVPANGSVTLPGQGATTAAIRMVDTGTNQDACQNSHLTLDFAGSAHS